jgi:hypothetical protein
MESWRASIIPMIKDSSEGNGFVAIVTSEPSPRTSNSSIIETIVTVASKERLLYSSSKKRTVSPSFHPQSSPCQRLTISQREPSRLSVLFEAIGSWISSENILNFLKPLSIPMSELKSLPACIKFKSTQVMNLLLPFDPLPIVKTKKWGVFGA